MKSVVIYVMQPRRLDSSSYVSPDERIGRAELVKSSAFASPARTLPGTADSLGPAKYRYA